MSRFELRFGNASQLVIKIRQSSEREYAVTGIVEDDLDTTLVDTGK